MLTFFIYNTHYIPCDTPHITVQSHIKRLQSHKYQLKILETDRMTTKSLT